MHKLVVLLSHRSSQLVCSMMRSFGALLFSYLILTAFQAGETVENACAVALGVATIFMIRASLWRKDDDEYVDMYAAPLAGALVLGWASLAAIWACNVPGVMLPFLMVYGIEAGFFWFDAGYHPKDYVLALVRPFIFMVRHPVPQIAAYLLLAGGLYLVGLIGFLGKVMMLILFPTATLLLNCFWNVSVNRSYDAYYRA